MLLEFLIFLLAPNLSSPETVIEVPNNASTLEVPFFQQFRMDPNSTVKIRVENFSSEDYFAILQTHSHIHNLTLAMLQDPFNLTTGTNVGFTIYEGGEFEVANKKHFTEVDFAVALVFYNRSEVPEPGGCFGSPILRVSDRKGAIWVSSEVSRAPGFSKTRCRGANLTYEVRYRYKSIGDMSPRTYFLGIQEMLSLSEVKRNSRENGLARDREGAYVKVKQTLIVFQTLVEGRAVYIPATSYSCNPTLWESNCFKYEFLVLVFFSVTLSTAFVFAIKMICPPEISQILVIVLTGVVVVTFGTIESPKEVKVFAFVVVSAFSAAFAIKFSRLRPPVSRFLVCLHISLISLLAIFYLANASYNLLEYQYGFIGLFSAVSGVCLYSSSIRDTPLFTFLACLMALFSLSYVTGGQIFSVLYHPYYLMEDTDHKLAVQGLLIAPQDGLVFCFVMMLGVVMMVSYQHYGEVWFNIVERDRAFKMQHPETCTIEERRQIASENAPLITRWTEGEEDDVFESPRTNHEFFEKIRNLSQISN